MSNIEPYGIHWFRRDLRVSGNPGLNSQFKQMSGRTIGLFCFDKKFLSRPDFSADRFQFFLETLKELKKELRLIGSDLLVLDTGPEESIEMLLKIFEKQKIPKPSYITWNRDYEPFAIKRDLKISKLLQKRNIDYRSFRDHLIIEPQELLKDDGSPYKVYTPFSKKWLKLFSSPEFQRRINKQKVSLKYLDNLKNNGTEKYFNLKWIDVLKTSTPKDHLDDYLAQNSKSVSVAIPPSGSLAAYEALIEFSNKIQYYENNRDFPSKSATSKLACYLKNGSLTTAQIIHFLGLKEYQKKATSKDIFLSELIWREFFYHILYHYPYVEEKAFTKKYQDIKWHNDNNLFTKWKTGDTGFPIIDAAMKQLNQTGWMHNRLRMIVASFLVKDLLIDWRWGEKYFMERLLDGDLAANNGGWQWAASTGCDAQPYFRIFNPWLQSKKFDPDGEFIKKYLPCLQQLKPNELHQPIIGHPKYPEPIVDHKSQKDKALALYKSNSHK